MTTTDLEKLYDEPFFQQEEFWKRSGYFALAHTIVNHLKPLSVVDVGCGDGILVMMLQALGVKASGLEGSKKALKVLIPGESSVTHHDLRTPYESKKKYDLAISIEVAEHLPPRSADVFLNTLTNLSDTVYLTAAPPGQQGVGHVNCQKKQYWISKMKDRGFSLDDELTKLFFTSQKLLIKGRRAYLYSNLMIFRRTNQCVA